MELKNFGYPGYLISDDGQLWSERSQKFLKPSLTRYGYYKYTISINNQRKTFFAHRLVAIAFIPNPNNLPQVNHKDENKLNNHVDNLEWCDFSYNNNYGTHNNRMSQTKKEKGCTGKKVGMYDKNTNELLKIFISGSEAARYLGKAGPSGILRCCNHDRNYKTAFGYKWKFIQEEKEEEK